MKSVLITGGLGFIGSHLLEELKDKYNVTVIDNYSNNKIDKFEYAKIINADIRYYCDNNTYDYVINLAAIATLSNEFDPELLSVNCAGFENIYRNIKCKNFIYISSAAAINKLSDYGKTKAHNEFTAKDSLGFRLFNVYGERDNGVVGKIKKGSAVVYGGNQTRDFIYVKDVVKCIVNNIDEKGVIEVGTGIETSIKDLATLIGHDYRVEPEKEWEEKRSVCLNPIDYKYKLIEGLNDY